MLSNTAEYALRIMIVLAEDGDTPQTSEQIAEATKVSADYAVKILQWLGRAGMVDRGVGRPAALSGRRSRVPWIADGRCPQARRPDARRPGAGRCGPVSEREEAPRSANNSLELDGFRRRSGAIVMLRVIP